MQLHDLTSGQRTKKRKRVGRGQGTGWGQTCGKGEKGQKSRSGFSITPGFEGGQMPLHRRLPKRGFRHPSKTQYLILNITDIERMGLDEVSNEVLTEKGLQSAKHPLPIKVLGDGEISRAIKVKAEKVSKSAAEKIKAAGGSIEEAK